MSVEPTVPDRIVTKKAELNRITGTSPTTRWRMRKLGTFPDPLQVSPGLHGYRLSELEAWMESLSRSGLPGPGDEDRADATG